MSTDRKRLTSAIQRIALGDPEIRRLLGESEDKGGKSASAGVGSSDADRDRQCCDGSVSDNANPGTESRDPDSEDAGQEGGLNDDDPANLDMGQGSLSGVTDCATGEPVCFDGGDWIPPEGWDGPTDPPLVPGYVEGVYWRLETTPGGIEYYQAESSAISEQISICIASGCTESSCNEIDEDRRVSSCNGVTTERTEILCEDQYNSICDDPPPLLDSWPSDGCTNLAIKGGKIVGSKFDPENDGSYSKPRSEIELCDGSGNKIKLSPGGDGGWKTIDANNPGDGYLYNSQGEQIARISDDEYSDPNV